MQNAAEPRYNLITPALEGGISLSKQNTVTTAASVSEATYFRLCHFCFHLNEGDQPIMDCEECEQLISSAPIDDFYEDVYEAQAQAQAQKRNHTNEEEEDEARKLLSLPHNELRGLSVIW